MVSTRICHAAGGFSSPVDCLSSQPCGGGESAVDGKKDSDPKLA